jgi:hypothetical protein
MLKQFHRAGRVPQMLNRNVCVQSRRLNAAVAKHDLDHTQIGPGFEEMGREAMSQRIPTLPANWGRRELSIGITRSSIVM